MSLDVSQTEEPFRLFLNLNGLKHRDVFLLSFQFDILVELEPQFGTGLLGRVLTTEYFLPLLVRARQLHQSRRKIHRVP